MIVLLLVSCQTQHPDNAVSIQGAWQPQSYSLKEGGQFQVDGLIFFTKSDWTVLFFVLDEDGTPQRGSAEGGGYTLAENRLTFAHHYHLSGGSAVGSLPETPLTMEIRSVGEATKEACTIDLSNDHLTIRFPSGNSMTFKRMSEFQE
ncbi:MAG: hypothetical protein ACE5EY_12050 [Anaerolineae bacterium]